MSRLKVLAKQARSHVMREFKRRERWRTNRRKKTFQAPEICLENQNGAKFDSKHPPGKRQLDAGYFEVEKDTCLQSLEQYSSRVTHTPVFNNLEFDTLSPVPVISKTITPQYGYSPWSSQTSIRYTFQVFPGSNVPNFQELIHHCKFLRARI